MRLVETGHTAAGDEQLAAAAEEYLAPMREKGVCALLLGCTHFDFAADAIRECLGGAALVSAAGCAAESMCAYLEENGLTGRGGSSEFYTSGDPAEFAAHAEGLLGYGIAGHVHAASADGMEDGA